MNEEIRAAIRAQRDGFKLIDEMVVCELRAMTIEERWRITTELCRSWDAKAPRETMPGGWMKLAFFPRG